MNVHDEFTRRVAADRLCRELARAIAENDTAALERLGMRGFGLYAGRLSELMTDSVRRELLGTDDFAGTDFGAIMGEVAKPAHYAHHLVNEGGSAIQQALDRQNGVRLRVVEPEFNDGRLKGIVGQIAESDSENAADNLATQLGTFVKDMGNEFMRQNAEQRDRAGFKVTITRTGGAKCCPWCADRTGTWELKAAPDGVFGVHDNCKCMVDYTNSKGTVRGRAVTHKIDGKTVSKWEFADKIPYTSPRVLTREEAAARGGFSQPRRLTGRADGGILNYRDSNDVYKPVAPEAYSRIKPLDVFGDQRDHQVAAAMRYVLDQVVGEEPGTEYLAIYDELTISRKNQRLSPPGLGYVKSVDYDKPYISIHNHASGETISTEDIIQLYDHQNCKAVYVVGNNGNCYSLKKTDRYDSSSLFSIIMQRRMGYEPYKSLEQKDFIKECEKYGLKYSERTY